MQKISNSKFNIFLKTAFLMLVFSFCILIFKPQIVSAATCASHTLSGFAWSENIGWLSMSCANQTPIGTGTDYGIDLNPSTGKFSGYAWSENIGWIDFGPSNPPAAPGHEAKLTGTTVTGWARACVVFQSGCSGALRPASETGGWDGWIKMSNGNYGVTLNSSTCEFEGFAFGGDDSSQQESSIGWLSFNRKNCDSNSNGVSDTGNYSQCPVGQPVSNYKVTMGSAAAPPSNLQVKAKNSVYYTEPYNIQDLTPDFQWTPAGSQTEYEIEVATDSGFTNLIWNPAPVVSSASTNITYAGSALTWANSYYWRVKTKGACSWSNWTSSKFYLNRPPIADFSISHSLTGTQVTFIFTSTSVDPDVSAPASFPANPALAGSIASCQWDLDGNGSFETSGCSASKIYGSASPSVTVTLRVTDDGGLTATYPETVTIQYLPQLITESGDIYAKGNIQGKNINFDAAYLIHAGGAITNVTKEHFQNYGEITFPSGTYQKYNILGKIDWEGLGPPSGCTGIGVCSQSNNYGYTVERINNSNQIDNPLSGKVYYYNGNLTIGSALTFNNSSSGKANGVIMVNGDLIINNNITYGGPSVNKPQGLASVAWLIKGDLIISPAVTNLVGAFVVLGDGANTCNLIEIVANQKYRIAPHCGMVKTGSNIPTPDVSLEIKGLLFARRLFFQRASKTLLPTDYAEKVIYDYQLFLNPPPGLADFIEGLPIWQNVAP